MVVKVFYKLVEFLVEQENMSKGPHYRSTQTRTCYEGIDTLCNYKKAYE